MQELKTLIDKASKMCGSDKALAHRIGVKVQVLSMLRHGRTITPGTAAELADAAGENVIKAAIQALLESAVGTRREFELERILRPFLFSECEKKVVKNEVTSLYQPAQCVLSATWGGPPYPTLFVIKSGGSL